MLFLTNHIIFYQTDYFNYTYASKAEHLEANSNPLLTIYFSYKFFDNR
ncbi:hypothetical protein SBF1_9670002 [Candidatus Desulfosporosinus infrequens]|uniref:Uncharacterized protein n=1 Tax=Candidatus Desulfosporosinus infrequens TaxID=2043169 RepID=A0A2U3LYP8_9FIRM|nr:hypothetical protein SBF1_9670002 [Candidatus Desulfosporosinus infrequens]